MKCKNGKLKTPVRLPSGRMRYCKKSRRKSPSRKCKNGNLKTPVRLPSGRRRYCKKKS